MDGSGGATAARVAAVAIAAFCLVSVPAAARLYQGSASANKVEGTKRADRIALKGGSDRAWGRGGADRISGGGGRDSLRGNSGRDRVSGGAGHDRVNGGTGNDRLSGGSGVDRLTGGDGRDRLAGGAGHDLLDSADGRRDARVDGGPGYNRCSIDAADLEVARRCSRITIVPDTGRRRSRRGAAAVPPGTLVFADARGLSCASSLPTCGFVITGTGADDLVGTVSGSGGAQLAAGVAVGEASGDWTARGEYGCTAAGALVVSIGEEAVRVPVSCN